MKGIFAKKIFKVAIVAALICFVIFLNPMGLVSPVRNVLTFVIYPFQQVFYSVASSIDMTGEFISSIGQLKNDNEKLLKENLDLKSENARLQDTENQNAILREQLDILPRDHFDLTAAFVVSQDPNGMGNWLEINKGSQDGVEKGDSVIISKGILIGRVQEVGLRTSKVTLLTSPQSTVNVITLKNAAKGVVKGEYGIGIILDMVLQTDAIEVGDELVTSGISGDVPRGLYVGKVQQIHQSDDHLFQQAVIASPVQASKLQIVFVIKEIK